MLTSIAPPGGIGNCRASALPARTRSGSCCSLFFLYAWLWNPHPLFGLDLAAHEPERAVGFLAAIALVVFGLPVFFLTRDTRGTATGALDAVKRGVRALAHTIVKVRDYSNVAMFLLARVIFNEGFVVLVIFTGVFAAGILHWSAVLVTLQGIFNSITAVIGALFAGWLDTKTRLQAQHHGVPRDDDPVERDASFAGAGR